MGGNVYLLMSTDSDGEIELFKIGITKSSIDKRIKSLSTGNPNKIILINSYFSENYKEIEKRLHAMFSLHKTDSKNEWFKLKDDDVINFTNHCKKIDETIEYVKNLDINMVKKNHNTI
jgi:hypothetical protein